MFRTALLPCFVSLVQLCAQPAPLPRSLRNGGFQEAGPGGVPAGWRVNAPGGVVARREAGAGLDRPSVVIRLGEGADKDARPNLAQALDARPFRGKRVRLTALLQREGGGTGTGHLWLRVDRPGGAKGFFDGMRDRPVTATAWTAAEIVGDVALDAERIVVGAWLLGGGGSLGLAQVSLETLGDTPVPEAPRPLGPRGLRNLVAFARAYGYVRFFHPADAAEAAPWDEVARAGVRAAEGAADDADLARRLRAILGPYAPMARFLEPGQRPQPLPRPREAAQVVQWRHYGVGLSRKSVYCSTRTYTPLARKGRPGAEPVAAPCFDLGGGVRLQLPLGCYADRHRRTLPRTGPAPAPPGILPEPTWPVPAAGNAEDRATRLGAVVEVWNVIQHFYPNFDWTQVDWPAQLPRVLAQVAESPSPEAYLRSVRTLMASLQDAHGYVSPLWREVEAGPGLSLAWVGSDLAVCGVAEDLKATVHAGDVLVAVDGVPTARAVAELAPTLPASSTQGLRYLEATGLLQGPAGSVELTLRGEDGAMRTVRVQRPFRQTVPREPRPAGACVELRPGVWYVDLARLTRETVESTLQAIGGARALVLDMRGYPSFGAWQKLFAHFTDAPLQTPPFLVPVITRPDRGDLTFQREGWSIQPEAPKLEARRFFLVDARAISQAELLMDFVEHYKLGEILGEATAGVDGNVNPFLAGGLRIAWTGMKVPKHDGTPLAGVGILPTLPVARTLEGLRAGRDEVLDRALDLALGAAGPAGAGR